MTAVIPSPRHGMVGVALIALLTLPAAHAEGAGEYIWPAPTAHVISQGYEPRAHQAIDIGGGLADGIVAARDGKVVYALTGCENSNGLETGIPCGARTGCSQESRENHPFEGFCNYGFGNGVVLRHNDGAYTVYAHFSYVEPSLKRGNGVAQGQTLGRMGSSGRSTGIHLHFSVTEPKSSGFNKNRLNPAEVLPPFAYVATTDALEITANSARLEGLFSFLGTPPGQVGIFLGESASALEQSAEYFDVEYPDLTYMKMLYDVDNIDGHPLQPGTTYYWRCYAIQEGRMEWGDVRSFTTLEDEE